VKKYLLKLLPVLAAIALVFALSFAAFAEDASEPETKAGSAAESEVLTTGEVSQEDTAVEGSAAEPAAESAPAATESEAEQQESGGGSSSSFVRHLPRWITLFVIIILIGVAVILSRTKTKLGQKIAKFFRDYKSEISKISWYSPKETAKATGIVLVFIIGLAVAIGVLDFLFTQGIKLLAQLF
jgi:preprotein translocase SecE subunit